jgi:hypothetical protein
LGKKTIFQGIPKKVSLTLPVASHLLVMAIEVRAILFIVTFLSKVQLEILNFA